MPILINNYPVPDTVDRVMYVTKVSIVECPTKNNKKYEAQSVVESFATFDDVVDPTKIKKFILKNNFSKWNKKQSCTLNVGSFVFKYEINHSLGGYTEKTYYIAPDGRVYGGGDSTYYPTGNSTQSSLLPGATLKPIEKHDFNDTLEAREARESGNLGLKVLKNKE